jgi:DNA-binding cell septation regulator SpoVG
MHITIQWFNDQFNVHLSSAEGKDDFLSIKGCRVVDGRDGPFISWPATKNQSTGKYWNHVWANEKFAAVVLAKANEARQTKQPRQDVPDDDIPF